MTALVQIEAEVSAQQMESQLPFYELYSLTQAPIVEHELNLMPRPADMLREPVHPCAHQPPHFLLVGHAITHFSYNGRKDHGKVQREGRDVPVQSFCLISEYSTISYWGWRIEGRRTRAALLLSGTELGNLSEGLPR